MPIYKPSELIAFLESLGIAPKKSLSQNFLIDSNIIQKIIKESKIGKEDIVLEIGPGPGSLTEALLAAGAKVVAVDKDLKLAQALRRLDPEGRQLDIICEDILNIHLPLPRIEHKIKVVGNLPYSITTPILLKFATMEQYVESITVMVQDEVAHRLAAKPKTSAYSSLTLFLQFYSDVFYAFKVSRNCFYPAPSVDSAIVTLQLKAPPKGIDPEKFFLMTRKAFQMRRKTLKRSLSELYPKEDIEKALNTLNFRESARPEELSLEQFISLFKELNP